MSHPLIISILCFDRISQVKHLADLADRHVLHVIRMEEEDVHELISEQINPGLEIQIVT